MSAYRWLAVLVALALVAGGLKLWWPARPSLPYSDSFARNTAAEWTPYAGQWQITQGMVVNRSDEDGAKLVSGDPNWSDYELDTDLKLVGLTGNAGVILRVSEEEVGADAYNGYYVGLRSDDSAFVAGRADHGFLGGHPFIVRGGVRPGTWYHLRVLAVGCELAAEATNLSSGLKSYLALSERDCVRKGRIGLRSMGMGGSWKNVRVLPATTAQLREIASHAAFVASPMYPIREDEYNHMMEELAIAARGYSLAQGPGSNADWAAPVSSIASGKAIATPDSPVHFRGIVTLTSPVYIQDDTGGVELRGLHDSDLNLGDEIEVQGAIVPGAISPFLNVRRLRVVSERTPVAPVAVNGTQAADGTFDGRLVELDGTLVSRTVEGDVIRLRLTDGDQTFQAVVRGLLASGHIQHWAPDSQLRLRGICQLGPMPGGHDEAFSLLLRSVDEAELLTGPPWWTPHLILRYVLALLVLLGLSVYLYLRTERNKMQAILEERERLAHEMHDTLAQSFAGVGFQLQGVRNSLRSGALPLPAVLEKLDTACSMVTRTHREASAEIAALHPGTADEIADLLTGLERTTHAMAEEHLPPMILQREGTPRTLSLPVRDTMFQVGREAIANILRHSSATAIVLRLRYEARHLTLEIIDNGCGFQYEEHASGFGIRGMRRRVERVGGTLTISTKPGQGTTVAVVARYGARFGIRSMSERLRSHAGAAKLRKVT